MSDYFDPGNQELLADFFQEASLQGELLEQNILALEQDPKNRNAVDELFRAAHTLKGGAATVGMKKLAEITHLMEDVLDEIRSGKKKVSGDVIDCLLASIDVIKAMLESSRQGKEYRSDTAKIETRLRTLIGESGDVSVKKGGGKGKHIPALVKKPTDKTAQTEKSALSEYEFLELKEAAGGSGNVYEISVDFDEENPMNTVGGIQVYAALKEAGTILKTVPEFEKLYQDDFYPLITYYMASAATESQLEKICTIPDVTLAVRIVPLTFDRGKKRADEKQTLEKEAPEESVVEEGQEPGQSEKSRKLSGSVLRVDSKRIDQLLNLVSEVVINKASFNQLAGELTANHIQFQNLQDQYREKMRELFDSLPSYLDEIQAGKSLKAIKKDILTQHGNLIGFYNQYESTIKDTMGRLKGSTQGLARITGELQEGVMQIRMVPISQIFSRFPRLVRDLSKTLGKNIQLTIQGEDTELDKSVIEDLLDPLIHCVRNSIDHGLEDPGERTRLGKNPNGNILLRASNEGNMVVIEITDDGRGIDLESIRKRAIEGGFIHEHKNLSEIEAFALIFEPGFSTAKTVTDVSGRGVGLDVVKRQIDKLSGTVSVWSEKNTGTTFTIKLPLTLAIIQGLLVRLGKNIFAIPITAVLETLKVKLDEIRRIDNYEVFSLRDEIISLMRLQTIFHIDSPAQGDMQYIVVVGSKDSRIGILVDSLIGEEDVVIKPLKDRFTRSPGIAGASILGDGTVSLIIDVAQLLDLGMKMGMEERRQRHTTGGAKRGKHEHDS